MKLKTYFMILLVLFVLLFYNSFSYWFANNMIDDRTKYQITTYFNNRCDNCNFKYKYIKATLNEDQTINVFIKTDNKDFNKYYRVIFENNGGYNLIKVNQDIPAYIK